MTDPNWDRSARRLGRLLGVPVAGVYREMTLPGEPAGWWLRLESGESVRLGTASSLRRPRELAERLSAVRQVDAPPLSWRRTKAARALLETLEEHCRSG